MLGFSSTLFFSGTMMRSSVNKSESVRQGVEDAAFFGKFQLRSKLGMHRTNS
jgi:hypothetical protein